MSCAPPARIGRAEVDGVADPRGGEPRADRAIVAGDGLQPAKAEGEIARAHPASQDLRSGKPGLPSDPATL